MEIEKTLRLTTMEKNREHETKELFHRIKSIHLFLLRE